MMKDSPTTKKMLVAFDPANPEKSSSDFLVPIFDNGNFVLFGTKSKCIIPMGMVVFVGREITVSDMFARLVDSGRKIPMVAEALDVLSGYLKQMNELKIGQVVQVNSSSSKGDFSLEVVKVTKRSFSNPPPTDHS